MEKAHFGCAWIVDKLIAVRELEEKLVAAFETGNGHGEARLRWRLAELNQWLDQLDQVLDSYGSRKESLRLPRAKHLPHQHHLPQVVGVVIGDEQRLA